MVTGKNLNLYFVNRTTSFEHRSLTSLEIKVNIYTTESVLKHTVQGITGGGDDQPIHLIH